MTSYNAMARYQHFNDLLFEGKLPVVPITFRRIKGAGGVARAQAFRQNGVKVLVPGSLSIQLDNTYKRTAEQYDQLLVHEMLHIYFYVTGDIDENHGPSFQAMVHTLNRKLDFEVPLTENTRDLALEEGISKRVGVLVLKLSDGPAFILLSEKLLRMELKQLIERFSRYEVLAAVVDSPFWSRKALEVPVQRTTRSLKAWKLVPEGLEDLLRNGTILFDGRARKPAKPAPAPIDFGDGMKTAAVVQALRAAAARLTRDD